MITLDLLRENLQEWKGCDLAKTARPVFGEGNPHAELFFIGEAPGKKEDELGRPFVGAAGTFLDALLESIGLKREDVYISNIVKYRPPENRDPTDEEKAQCLPWLLQEIAIIKPKVIVPLGRHALGHFLKEATIGSAHGKPFVMSKSATVFPMYHPAAALHNGSLRSVLAADFQALKTFLNS